MEHVLSFFTGVIALPWWGYLLVALGFTHVTIAAVTIYLHRHQAHRALDLHPFVSHFFRFWLWLTTGMVTKEWAAIHRKHHAHCETANDPHSPQFFGINKVLWEGAELYRIESKNQETLQKYGSGTPDDWIEQHLYTRYSWQGVALMLIINFILFGMMGLAIWAVQMMWIPFFAAGVINGLGHWWGYRNFESEDTSTNLIPWGILIGGEELHNNHHAYGSSAKFSAKWYEFDLGWAYIQLLSFFRLAQVKKVAPPIRFDWQKAQADFETLQAVLTHRYAVLKGYAAAAKIMYKSELERLVQQLSAPHKASSDLFPLLSDKNSRGLLKLWLNTDWQKLSAEKRAQLEIFFNKSNALQTVYTMRQELVALWAKSSESREQLLQRLQDWCQRAEASGIGDLQLFARRLRAYS